MQSNLLALLLAIQQSLKMGIHNAKEQCNYRHNQFPSKHFNEAQEKLTKLDDYLKKQTSNQENQQIEIDFESYEQFKLSRHIIQSIQSVKRFEDFIDLILSLEIETNNDILQKLLHENFIKDKFTHQQQMIIDNLIRKLDILLDQQTSQDENQNLINLDCYRNGQVNLSILENQLKQKDMKEINQLDLLKIMNQESKRRIFVNNEFPLIRKYFQQNYEQQLSEKYKDFRFVYYCSENDILGVEFLLKKNVDLDMKDSTGQSCIHIACEKGYFSILRLLKQYNVSIDMLNDNNESGLMLATGNQHYKIVQYLIRYKANLHLINKQQRNVLIIATLKKDMKMIKILIEAGFDINKKESRGIDLFAWSIKNNHREIQDLLFSKGLDLSSKKFLNQRIFELFKQQLKSDQKKQCEKFIEILIRNEANFEDMTKDFVKFILSYEDQKFIKKMLPLLYKYFDHQINQEILQLNKEFKKVGQDHREKQKQQHKKQRQIKEKINELVKDIEYNQSIVEYMLSKYGTLIGSKNLIQLQRDFQQNVNQDDFFLLDEFGLQDSLNQANQPQFTYDQSVLYQEKVNENQAQRQAKFAEPRFTNCISDTNMAEAFENATESDNGSDGQIKNMELGVENNKKIYAIKKLISIPDEYTYDQIQNELQVSEFLMSLGDISVQRYYACYVGFDSNSKFGIYLQYERLQENLDLQTDEEAKKILNDPRAYVESYQPEERIKNFLPLFYTMSKIHENNILMRNINPFNIMTSVSLFNLNGDKKQALQLKFTDFSGYLINQKANDVVGDQKYQHPLTAFLLEDMDSKANDVYAICASYFEIETQANTVLGNGNYKVESIFDPEVYNIDDGGEDFDEDKQRSYAERAFDYMQNQIYENFLKNSGNVILNNKKRLDLSIKVVLNDVLEQNKFCGKELDQVSKLVCVCARKPNCIIYAGLQPTYDLTPNIDLIYQALLKIQTRLII